MSTGAFNGYKVAKAWHEGKAAASGSFRTDGQRIFTYGVQLAHTEDGKLALDVPDDWKNSVTSNKHMNMVRLMRDNIDFCLMMAEEQEKRDAKAAWRRRHPTEARAESERAMAAYTLAKAQNEAVEEAKTLLGC